MLHKNSRYYYLYIIAVNTENEIKLKEIQVKIINGQPSLFE